jgi:hypothetical protein
MPSLFGLLSMTQRLEIKVSNVTPDLGNLGSINVGASCSF